MTDFRIFRELYALGRSALSAPAEKPAAALVAIAVLIVALLIVTLFIYLIVASVRHRGERVLEVALTPAQRRSRRIVRAVVLLVVLGLFAVGWTYTGSDNACARCHYNKPLFDSRNESAHEAVACKACHIGPGLDSSVLARVKGLKNAARRNKVQADDQPAQTSVANRACLSCHEAVLSGVMIARSIKVRHSDFLAIGRACTDCHSTEGHGNQVARPRYPNMVDCIACHDGVRVTAACDTCHSKDVGVAIRHARRQFAKADVRKDDCRGCHPMTKCIDCHGLELPHSQQFIEGYHAKPAYDDPALCLKCHDVRGFCNGCHRFKAAEKNATGWTREHESLGDFKVWHSQESTAGILSCSCHTADRKQFCQYCHGKQPDR